MAKTAVDKIRDLDAQRTKLIAAAKSEAVKRVEGALKELNDLGFNYRLVVEDRRPRHAKKPMKGRGKGRVKNSACKICGFKTVPVHDGRKHRGQSKKAPFTAQELIEHGLNRL